MVKHSRSLFGALVVALAFVVPAPAFAQSDAPRVDPDSPAGIEYELPIDRAREDAVGGGAGGSSGRSAGGSSRATAGESPLFGEGVTRSASGSVAKGGSGSGKALPKTSATTAEPFEGAAPGSATVRAQTPSPDSGGGELLTLAAGAGGVLLLGGLAGLLWRRRSIPG